MPKATVDGDARPAGSEPQNGADAAADAVNKLGAMAVQDEPQATDEPDQAADAPEGDVDQPAADEDAADDTAPESEDEADADAEQAEDAEHRSPRAERRIAELTAKTKQAESKLEQAETRVKEVEAVAAQGIGLHPDYVTEPEAKLLARVRDMQARERELLKHWDGIDDTDPGKSRTAEQVRTEWAEIRSQLDDAGPRARSLYDDRLKQMVEDMKVGRRLRLERSNAVQKRGAPADAPRAKLPAPAAVPRGSASGTPVNKRGAPAGPNAERFRKAGASREAAATELQMLAGTD